MDENALTPPTQAERSQAGRALRKIAPRSSQAGWAAPPRRPDPVAQLVAQDKVRIPELVPIRHGRMAVSPFTFLRGAAAVMARAVAAGANVRRISEQLVSVALDETSTRADVEALWSWFAPGADQP